MGLTSGGAGGRGGGDVKETVCLCVGGVQIKKNKGEVDKVHFQQKRQVGLNVL